MPGGATLPPTAARMLWVRMAEIYGSRWTSAYGDNPNEGAALTWAKGLGGMRPQQLADGLRNCIASADPWPPTLPAFRAMCLNIPTLALVRSEIHDEAGRSAFTRLVWQKIDSHAFKQASNDKADRMIRDAYDLAREFVMRGGKLPEPISGQLPPTEKSKIKLADPDAPAKAHEALWGSAGKMAAAGPDA